MYLTSRLANREFCICSAFIFRSGRGGHAKLSMRAYNPLPTQNPMLIKHVFTSSQGVPVTMAVLPPPNNEVGSEFGVLAHFILHILTRIHLQILLVGE